MSCNIRMFDYHLWVTHHTINDQAVIPDILRCNRMFAGRVASLTSPLCPVIVLITAPVPTFHTLMVLSPDPLARVRPSGLKLTEFTCNRHIHAHTHTRTHTRDSTLFDILETLTASIQVHQPIFIHSVPSHESNILDHVM